MPSTFTTTLAVGIVEMIASDLGQTVTYTPSGGVAVVIRAVVSFPSSDESSSPGKYPRLTIAASSLLSSPAPGDQVTIDGVTYSVYGEPRERPAGIWRVYAR